MILSDFMYVIYIHLEMEYIRRLNLLMGLMLLFLTVIGQNNKYVGDQVVNNNK